jgi:hypothetical protein
VSDAMARRLLMEKVITNGTAWLQSVLDANGVDKISSLTRAQLVAIIEGRDA